MKKNRKISGGFAVGNPPRIAKRNGSHNKKHTKAKPHKQIVWQKKRKQHNGNSAPKPQNTPKTVGFVPNLLVCKCPWGSDSAKIVVFEFWHKIAHCTKQQPKSSKQNAVEIK